MNRWHQMSEEDKRIAYNQIAVNTGLPAYAIEKDWWVVQTLAIIFDLKIGQNLVFKGGTSLSKAWNLIERFSEDIDLAIDRSFFGFEGALEKKQRTKLRKASKSFISGDLFNEIQGEFDKCGLVGVEFSKQESSESDLDPVSIFVKYPQIIKSPGYIEPRVKI
ncbi:MAG: nucleotidyl transferase AbiEii/AbiGii toxin family protein, partial [Marinilabiliales bacterium]